MIILFTDIFGKEKFINMRAKLGEHILELRKIRGITQEQLAVSVGVSAPAVSKWETSASCPDILLLCPIARALGVNVDQLLQFEDILPENEMVKHINEIIECARKETVEVAESKLNQLLYTYPSDYGLKYHAAITFDMFRMFNPLESTERNQKWKNRKRKLLEEILKAGSSRYYEKTLSSLISIFICEEKLDEAENLLNELPKDSSEYAMLWAQFYIKTDSPEKALEVTQKRLYSLTRKLQMCMVFMMNEKMIPEPEHNFKICQIYRQIEQIFNVGGETSEGLFVEAYKRMGNYVEAKNCAIKMIYQLMGSVESPNQTLFYPTLKIEDGVSVATKEMKKMLLDGIMKEDFLSDFQEDVELQLAINKLRESIL